MVKENGGNIIVQDGATFEVELFENDCRIHYSTYSPHIYIENGYPHFQERKNLL